MLPAIKTITVSAFGSHSMAETDYFKAQLKQWQMWARQSRDGSCECRDIAAERLKACLTYRHARLDLSNLRLTVLPELLPDFLQELDVSDNLLRYLPEKLPASLERLSVDNNRLVCLPKRLPCCLDRLSVSGNRLTHLPARLPLLLRFLDANYNQLSTLPDNLPVFLKGLYVSHNQLRSLPLLPGHLKYLDVSHNQLVSLPVHLPVSLKILCAGGNQLSDSPTNLPNLSELPVANNQLTCLPETLPGSLERIHIDSNPITIFFENLPDWLMPGDSSEQVSVFWCRTLSGFLATLYDWDSSLDKQRWQAIHAEDNASIFAHFLCNLHRGKNAHNHGLHCWVANWLNYLAGDDRHELRKHTFLLAKEAMEICLNRPSFYFIHMHILMVENELINTSAPLIHIVNTILGTFRLQILERIAAEKTADRRQNLPGFSEDLEIYLAYQCALQVPLSLPVYTEMQFEWLADITKEDIGKARQKVANAEKSDFVRHWLTKSALWTSKLEQWDPEKKAESDSQYLAAIAALGFNEAVNKALNENGKPVNDADAYRSMSQALAADLFYQQRYQLTQEYLAACGALSLLYQFSLPPLTQC